jgi:purine nucleosidase
MVMKTVLNCDPGVDDAWAILYALGEPQIDLLGIMVTGGNSNIETVTSNTLSLCDFVSADVPVAVGNPQSLAGKRWVKGGVHGGTGLGMARLPEPSRQPIRGTAADFLISVVREQPGEIHLVVTAPLTDVALALRQFPELVRDVAGITIMGGALSRGNVSPVSEFNIAADIVAATEVFKASWTPAVVGLDVTRMLLTTLEVEARLRRLGSLAEEILIPSVAGYKAADTEDRHAIREEPREAMSSFSNFSNRAMHDLAAVVSLVHPEPFRFRPGQLVIETRGEYTAGMTVVDFTAERANVRVALDLDPSKVWDCVLTAYEELISGATHSSDQSPCT